MDGCQIHYVEIKNKTNKLENKQKKLEICPQICRTVAVLF